jgi:hypothetical protein
MREEAEQRERKALARPCTTTRSRTCSRPGTSWRRPARPAPPAGARSRGRGSRPDDRPAARSGLRSAPVRPRRGGTRGGTPLAGAANREPSTARAAAAPGVPGRHPQEQLLYSAARELLANVVQHAEATEVAVALTADGVDLSLVVADDGRGFPRDRPAEALADGHVGLASQTCSDRDGRRHARRHVQRRRDASGDQDAAAARALAGGRERTTIGLASSVAASRLRRTLGTRSRARAKALSTCCCVRQRSAFHASRRPPVASARQV